MPAGLLVRGVDDALVQALKKRAGAHGRSQETELLAAMPDVGVDADFQRQHCCTISPWTRAAAESMAMDSAPRAAQRRDRSQWGPA